MMTLVLLIERGLSILIRPEVGILVGFVVGLLVGQMLRYRSRDLDEADDRRMLYGKLSKSHFPPIPSNVRYSRSFFQNSRGMLLHSQQFIPTEGVIKAVIGICHGFGDHCNALNAELALRFCKVGYAVICMDGQGHGYSDGMHAFVKNLSADIARDFSDYFQEQLQQRAEFVNKSFFVYGESMGGAVTFYLCTEHPIRERITGAILTAPMVKVADEVTPAPIVIELLKLLGHYFPYAPITPLPDIMQLAFKRKEMLERVKSCPLNYAKKVRLCTALALKNATDDINLKMEQFARPVLILHGEKDRVTDPQVSKALYDRCSSKDKRLSLYPDAWHVLINGEPTETADKVFGDIISWIDKRCTA